MKTLIGMLNVIMAVAFLISVAVQYSDSDGILWMAIYGAAAAACIGFELGRLRSWQALAIAALGLLWAVAVAPGFWGQVNLGAVFESLDMKTDAVERAREFGGLMIVFVWMGFLAWNLRSSQAPSHAVS